MRQKHQCKNGKPHAANVSTGSKEPWVKTPFVACLVEVISRYKKNLALINRGFYLEIIFLRNTLAVVNSAIKYTKQIKKQHLQGKAH